MDREISLVYYPFQNIVGVIEKNTKKDLIEARTWPNEHAHRSPAYFWDELAYFWDTTAALLSFCNGIYRDEYFVYINLVTRMLANHHTETDASGRVWFRYNKSLGLPSIWSQSVGPISYRT